MLRLAAAALLLALAWPGGGAGAPADATPRSAAFIGYTEHSGGSCRDALPDCPEDASRNKCLLEPYIMRTLCPISCSVERCSRAGDVLAAYRIPGVATAEATKAYAQSLQGVVAGNHFQLVPFPPGAPTLNQLTLSSCGLGTYLGLEDSHTDEQVLQAVLYGVLRGWNVIDTAPNYRGGRAEASVGAALQVLLSGGRRGDFMPGRSGMTRDALFVSTKAGFLSPALKDQLQEDGLLGGSDLVGGWHCMTPACIRASVESSLEALRLRAVDLVYLHNAAEMRLQLAGRRGFLAALEGAFRELEGLRGRGLIQGYGVATWDCFRRPRGHPQHLDLQDVVDVARKVGGDAHGLAAVQLPININMPEAWQAPWQALRVNQSDVPPEFLDAPPPSPRGPAPPPTAAAAAAAAGAAPSPPPPPPPPARPATTDVTLLEAARQLGLAVFVSGPLAQGSVLAGLPASLDALVATAGLPSSAAKLLQLVRSTPGVHVMLVGHKQRDHVTSNVALAAEPRMAAKMWGLEQKRLEMAAGRPRGGRATR